MARRLLLGRLMAVLVVVVVLMMVQCVISQSSNNNINTPIRRNCGRNPAMSPSSFFSNLNSTLAELRSKLSNNGVRYATAQNLQNGDSVYGVAQCRNYLASAQCVACFDVAMVAVEGCSAVNGANVFLDNCFLRYENYDEFIDDPRVVMDVEVAPVGICGNRSTSQPTSSFNQIVEGLLSDIRVAGPRTSNFYVASIRPLSSGNATVYAIAQCVQNTSQAICQNCLNAAYSNLYSCLPSSEGRTIDLGCFMRYSDTPFFGSNQTTDITPFLREGSSSKIGLVAGVSAGAGIFLLILVLCTLWYQRRKFKTTQEDASELGLQRSVNYSYEDLRLATHNFSKKYRVGKGGFGEVFQATLDDSTVVAVKKLQVGYGRAKTEFNNEVNLIGNVRHRNLLRLLGWCAEGSELLLVLEYMPQGSLDRFLWGEKRGTLNWKQRFDIILGIARGLAHLHDEFHVKIIHRDIKSSNILLDDEFQPKIADFGLARFQREDQSHVSTKFAGTLGYTAPEYATRGKLSDKVDTYSYGIVVLEIISGRRCTDMSYDGPNTDYLLEHAWKLYEKATHFQLVDETLDPNNYEQEHVMKVIEIALMCTQSPVSLRPTMSEVVLMLSSGRFLGQRQRTRPVIIDHDRKIHKGENGSD